MELFSPRDRVGTRDSVHDHEAQAEFEPAATAFAPALGEVDELSHFEGVGDAGLCVPEYMIETVHQSTAVPVGK
jgi:hypothetical protein